MEAMSHFLNGSNTLVIAIALAAALLVLLGESLVPQIHGLAVNVLHTFCFLLSCQSSVDAALYLAFLSGPKGDSVLLMGPCDSGKTTLFLQLRDGALRTSTVASMQPNEASIRLRSDKTRSSRPVHLVDIPGHPRLRRDFDRYVSSARGVVFLVDSVDFMPNKSATAE